MELRPYVLVTDSTADLPYEYFIEHNVRVIGMQYSIDGKEYIQFSEGDLDTKTFYDMIRNGSMPKTAQVPYNRLHELFKSIAVEGNDILYLSFSSALSGSYQTSLIVARDIMEEFPNIRVNVVDTLAASTGEGLIVHLCVKKRDEGMNLEELTDYADLIKHKAVHLFTVDDLNHLHRGGRVSKVSAVVGGMLGIKPVLHVNERGELINFAKARGRKAALETMLKQMQKTFIPEENEEIFVGSSDARADAELLADMIRKNFPTIKKIHFTDVGTVIGTHTGAGTVTLFFIGKNKLIAE